MNKDGFKMAQPLSVPLNRTLLGACFVYMIALYWYVMGDMVFYRDEAMPLLIASGNASLADLLNALKYEGTPGLWHLLLWLTAKITPLSPAHVVASSLAPLDENPTSVTSCPASASSPAKRTAYWPTASKSGGSQSQSMRMRGIGLDGTRMPSSYQQRPTVASVSTTLAASASPTLTAPPSTQTHAIILSPSPEPPLAATATPASIQTNATRRARISEMGEKNSRMAPRKYTSRESSWRGTISTR